MRKILFTIACAGLVLISSARASAQPAVYSTGADGSYPAVSGDIIAFSTHEWFAGQDLNGDDDLYDWVLRYYDISSQTLVNTGVANFLFDSPAISGNTIALAFSEWSAKKDLNGDGDRDDFSFVPGINDNINPNKPRKFVCPSCFAEYIEVKND